MFFRVVRPRARWTWRDTLWIYGHVGEGSDGNQYFLVNLSSSMPAYTRFPGPAVTDLITGGNDC